MGNEESVSEWIIGLKAGDQEAVQNLWNRYCHQLKDVARRRLNAMPGSMSDEEDVLQSVFVSLHRAAEAGRLDDVRDRDELWWMLLAITKQKAVGLIRRETAKKRGAGRVQSASLFGDRKSWNEGFEQLVADTPSPEFLAVMDEENRRLLGLLRDDQLRQVAVSRFEGYTVEEIASTLAISKRSVERKLQIIRKRWKKELVNAEPLSAD